MANEADSRDTTPTLRWGETAAEVPDANVVEPSGGLKNTGWIPGVSVPVAEWFNWLSWAAGVFNRYIERLLGLMWTRNTVLAGAAAGECEVTAGVGLTVDVAEGRVWMAGGMYTVPAETNLALTAAHATLDRIDLVTARVNSGVPEYFVVTGTPGVLPVAPGLPAGSVRLAEVLVEATSVVPDAITDVREFGAIDLDRSNIGRRLDVGLGGSLGAGESVFRVTDELPAGSGAGGLVRIGEEATPLVEVVTLSGFEHIQFEPEFVRFAAAIVRRWDIDATGFIAQAGTPALTVSWALDPSEELRAAVRVPHGCEIKAVRIYGTKALSTAGIGNLQLFKRDKNTNTRTDLITGTVTNVGDPDGDFVLAYESLAEVVDHGSTYYIELNAGGTGAIEIFAGEVEYEESRPWNGI